MLKGQRKWLLPIIAVILCVLWCALILLLARPGRFVAGSWLCFGLNILAFVLFAAVLVIVPAISAKAGINNVVPVYVAYVYLVLAVVLNTVGVILNKEGLKTLFTALNIALTGLFVIYELGALAFAGRTHDAVADAEKKAAQFRPVTGMINELLAENVSAETRKGLQKLKETVSYTTDTARYTSDDLMKGFISLKTAISENRSQEDINAAISKVETIWKASNMK